MDDDFFAPATVRINVGDKVHWRNDGIRPHTATSGNQPIADGLWDSGWLDSGGTYTHLFSEAGTYPYFCILHSGMTGTVVVSQ